MRPAAKEKSERPTSIVRDVALFAATRFVINTGYRMIYPLLPVFARGLAVSATAIARALMVRSFVGACSPLLSPLSDSIGRRAGMILGLVVFAAGAALVFMLPTFQVFVCALSIMVLGKYLFEPSMQAHIGETVSYRRRGFAIAISELGWSCSAIAGVPACAYVIARFGWPVPFAPMAILAAAAAALYRFLITGRGAPRGLANRWGSSFAAVGTHRPALIGLAVALLVTVGNEIVNVVFGVWLEGSFQLSLGGLGTAAVAIGTAELCGEVLSSLATDRLGKYRSVQAGLLLNIASAAVMWLLGDSLPGALAGLFLFFMTFEFGVVSLLPIMTELFPGARATLMGATVAAFSLGRALGALIAMPLYAGGLGGIVIGVLVFNGCAWAVLRRIRLQESA